MKTTLKILALIIFILYSTVIYADLTWCDGDLSQDDATEDSNSWCDTEEDPECAWYPSDNKPMDFTKTEINIPTLADMRARLCCNTLTHYYETGHATLRDVLNICQIDGDGIITYDDSEDPEIIYPIDSIIEDMYNSCIEVDTDEDGISDEEEDDNTDSRY
ncbi:hypothetical protein KJ708_06610 [bacterium]|nr:hypothetical protein [bacterium]MBU1919007.1 hypothetical protein [bacterium]